MWICVLDNALLDDNDFSFVSPVNVSGSRDSRELKDKSLSGGKRGELDVEWHVVHCGGLHCSIVANDVRLAKASDGMDAMALERKFLMNVRVCVG